MKIMRTKRTYGRKQGFTLIEMLISIGLFAILVLMVTTSFFYLIGVQRNLEGKQQILNDFRLAIDVMAKEMTSGSAFPDGCDKGCPNIIFSTKARPDLPLRNIEYRLNTTTHTIEKGEQRSYGLCASIPLDSKCYVAFNSDKVEVDELEFFVANKGTYTQPIVTIQITGRVLPGTKDEEGFQVSSSVTPRLLQDPAAAPPSDNEVPHIEINTADGSPVSGTYTSGSATIRLTGIASDNVGVTEVRWRNQATNATGIVSGGITSWDTGDGTIVLIPGVQNNITMSATDAAGLTGTAILTVNSSLPPAPPATPLVTAFPTCHDTGAVGKANSIRVYASCPLSTTSVKIYKCTGTCVPTLSDLFTTLTCAGGKIDIAIIAGTYYSYSGIAHSALTGLDSGMSAIVTKMAPLSDCVPPPPPPPSPPGTPPPPPSSFPSPPGVGTFEPTAVPNLITVRVSGTVTLRRNSTYANLVVDNSPDFLQNVQYSLVSGAPTGTIPNFKPNPITSAGYTTGTTFFVNIPDTTPIQPYTITLRATAQDGRTKDFDIVLDVQASGGGQQ